MLNEYFCVLGLMSSVEERVVWKAVYSCFPEQESPLEKAVPLSSPTPSLAGRKLAMLIEHLREKKIEKRRKKKQPNQIYINWQFKQDFSFSFLF